MRDQEQIVINDIKGLWTRDDMPPLGYGADFRDVRFDNRAVYTREYISEQFDLSVIGFGVNDRLMDFWPYRPSSAPFTERYLVLVQNSTNTNGRIYDTGKASPTVAILSIATMTNVSVIQLFDRAYISVTLANEFVYVWDAALMSAARKIAGVAPTTVPSAAIGAAGNCEPGLHLVSVIFETNTGFLTKPARNAGVSLATQITVPAGTPSIIALTSIPTGTAGVVVKRHILFTKVVPHYDGNPENYRYFLAATIADNSTTTFNLSVFDSQLVTEMSYLYKNKEEVECGTCLATHDGRLLVAGPRHDIYLVLASNAGDPETFSATDGFMIVGKGDGGRNQNAKSFRGNIYVWKGRRTYGVQPNSGPPNTWTVFNVDIGKGTGPNGVAQIVDAPDGVNQELLFIAALDGLWPFDGTYPEKPLSWVIEPDWVDALDTFIGTVRVCVDPNSSRIFVLTPNFASPVSGIPVWVCDFSDGLTYDQVKWCKWVDFADWDSPVQLRIEPFDIFGLSTNQITFACWDPAGNKFGGRLLNRSYVNNDVNSGGSSSNISWVVRFGNLGFEDSGKSTFVGYQLRGEGSTGTYDFSALGYDGNDSASELGLVWLGGASGVYERNLFNLMTEKLRQIQFAAATGSGQSKMALKEVIVYGKPTWA